MLRENFLREIFIIGFISIIVGFITTRVLSRNKYPAFDDPNLQVMLLNYFILGAVLHIVFEFSGYNKHFCESEFNSKWVCNNLPSPF